MKKPLPPVYFLLTLFAMVGVHLTFPMVKYWAFPVSLLGLAPIAAGITLNVLADRLFAKHETTVKPFEESTALVSTFPFSLTRNPMYLGVTLILLGVAMVLGTLAALLLAVAFPILIDVIFIRVEERMLAARFGDEWKKYRARVRRWL